MAGNLLSNAGFENSTGNDFDDWTESTAGSSTVTVNTTDPLRGTQCCQLNVDGSNSYVGMQQNPGTIEVGQEYTITFWAKADANCTVTTETWCTSTSFNVKTYWQKFSFTDVAIGVTAVIKRNGANNRTILIDQVSLVATPFKMAVLRGTCPIVSTEYTDFTETGFGTPKAAIVIMSTPSVAEPVRAQNMPCIGFWDGTTQKCVWCAAYNAQVTSSCDRGNVDDYIGYMWLANILYATYTISNITDGIRITMDYDNTGQARYAHVILFGGADVESDVSFAPLVINTQNRINVGFRPDLLLMAYVGSKVAFSPATNYYMSFGAASRYGLKERVLIASNSDAKLTTETTVRVDEDVSVGLYLGDKTFVMDGEVTQFTADGYILQTPYEVAETGPIVLALKIPGVDIALDTFYGANSTGNDSTTGVGFKPEYLMLANTMSSGVNIDTDGLSFGIGAATASEEYCMSFIGEDAVATSREYGRSGTKINNLYHPTHQSHEYSVASLSSFDDDGFTLNFTEAASGTIGWYLAFADTTQNRKLITT